MRRTYCIPQTELLKVCGTNDVLEMPENPTIGGSASEYNMAPSRNVVGAKLYV